MRSEDRNGRMAGAWNLEETFTACESLEVCKSRELIYTESARESRWFGKLSCITPRWAHHQWSSSVLLLAVSVPASCKYGKLAIMDNEGEDARKRIF